MSVTVCSWTCEYFGSHASIFMVVRHDANSFLGSWILVIESSGYYELFGWNSSGLNAVRWD